jgi:hypothetical protein
MDRSGGASNAEVWDGKGGAMVLRAGATGVAVGGLVAALDPAQDRRGALL